MKGRLLGHEMVRPAEAGCQCGQRFNGRTQAERRREHANHKDTVLALAGSKAQLRFWAKVRKTETCWLWTGGLTQNKYGRFNVDGRKHRVLAHRYTYELLVGPVPNGTELDHLCRVRQCVNPGHLEPVTHRENILRGNSCGGRRALKTHCIRGHEFTDANTLRSANERKCRACQRERYRKTKATPPSSTVPGVTGTTVGGE